MRHICLLMAGLLALPFPPTAQAQDAPLKLSLVVVEGEGAINNIRQRTAREPVVQVEDQNHRPVAGAAVVFSMPSSGPGGTFAGGAHSLTVTTDAQGRAVAHGLRPNNVQGQYQIRVNASSNGQTATTTISQSNAIIAGAAGAAAGIGISAKLLIIIAVAGAAAAGGALYATGAIGGGGNNNNPSAAASLVTINPGTGTVGPPR